MTIVFGHADQRLSWEKCFVEAKKVFFESSSRKPATFLNVIAIPRNRSGVQVFLLCLYALKISSRKLKLVIWKKYHTCELYFTFNFETEVIDSQKICIYADVLLKKSLGLGFGINIFMSWV